jgi:phosphotransferase system HPr (HPr) family protein
MIAEAARRFVAETQLVNGERSADAKAVLSLVSLNANFGTELILEANGEDASDAVETLGRLFDTNFDEETPPSEQ